ncbi:metalloregulator ArsR/SmtB family transcription factor [Jeotgalibacillus sp. R-1-5s-1]|uniref:ArsR/SmtB family transcription factor n=1 Tax=Jeotgalibacillus sp. R-1-5s-1 TaxID=2555897 RepID=UPI00106D5B35|nr:metalloregulator ArsR/SmtB family transcription factor [Jeotgalibacillus sp. R-1-5s-1]TFD98384.1 ArsR family transcriptional regulator [Jeotgalibacillus sp. R-1-5s-1]
MKSEVCCEATNIHPDKVKRSKIHLQETNAGNVANLFKALADDTRMKIALILSREDELCVCDVAEVIGSSNATASHHLRHLKSLGLAKSRKVGKQVYYSLDDHHVKSLIDLAVEHEKEVQERNESSE